MNDCEGSEQVEEDDLYDYFAMEDESVNGYSSGEEENNDGNEIKESFSLHRACARGDVREVKDLLSLIPPEMSAYIDLCDPTTRRSPIEIACARGRLRVVSLLLSRGASARPIDSAIESGNAEVVRVLLDTKEIMGTLSFLRSNYMYHAAASNNVEMVSVLLEYGMRTHTSTTIQPIHIAATNGSLKIVELLLEREVDVDEPDDYGFTSLMRAADSGREEVVKLLLRHGADPNTTSSKGETALSLALNSNHAECMRELIKKGCKFKGSSLLETACHKSVEVLRVLKDCGAKVKAKHLKLATDYGRIPIVEWMLDERKKLLESPDSVRPDSHSLKSVSLEDLLQTACYSGNIQLIQMLIDRGADAKTSFCGTPLLKAMCRTWESVHVVRILLDNGAAIHINEALNSAVENGHKDTVALLLEYGGRVTSNLFTVACGVKGDKHEIVKMLIEDTPHILSMWTTGLVGAIKCLNVGVVKLLLEVVPADIIEISMQLDILLPLHAISTATGETPLHIAVRTWTSELAWVYTTSGADFSISAKFEPKIVWDYFGKDPRMDAALYHFWTPNTHHHHPQVAKDGIKCILMVAKRNNWPFDQEIMQKIISYIAYNWTPFYRYQPPTLPSKRKQKDENYGDKSAKKSDSSNKNAKKGKKKAAPAKKNSTKPPNNKKRKK